MIRRDLKKACRRGSHKELPRLNSSPFCTSQLPKIQDNPIIPLVSIFFSIIPISPNIALLGTIVSPDEILSLNNFLRLDCFPKLMVPFLGVTIRRTIVYWGLYWGTLIWGNYHFHFLTVVPRKHSSVDLLATGDNRVHGSKQSRLTSQNQCHILEPTHGSKIRLRVWGLGCWGFTVGSAGFSV